MAELAGCFFTTNNFIISSNMLQVVLHHVSLLILGLVLHCTEAYDAERNKRTQVQSSRSWNVEQLGAP
jgi:hypothetical protein